MSQTIQTSDGITHTFPDEATPKQLQNWADNYKPDPAPGDPTGSIWYDTARGAERVRDPANTSTPGQLASDLISTDRTIGNDAVRGALRVPTSLTSTLPNFIADTAQWLTGTPWEKTSKVSDWVPDALTSKATDNLFSKALHLYSTEDPKDLRRYPGRAAEFGAAAATGGASTPQGLLAAVSGGLGSQAAQDAFPNSKYASTLGGVAGTLFGAAGGGLASEVPAAAARPSLGDIKAVTQRELASDADELTPQGKDFAVRGTQIKHVQKAIDAAENSTAVGENALDNVRTILDGVDFPPAAASAYKKVLSAGEGGGLLSNSMLRMAIRMKTGHIPLAIMDQINAMASKNNNALVTALQQLKDVVRTNKPYPTRPTGAALVPQGLLGVLQQDQNQ